jgi:hypothetical protein
MTVPRRRREPVCRWPHEILSAAAERALTLEMERYRPFIEAIALWLVPHDEDRRDEAVQEGFIMLWQWGRDRIVEAPSSLVEVALLRRMRKSRRREYRAMGGNRRVSLAA